MLPKVGQEVYIQSYKHDKSLHRTWAKAFVIEANDKQVVAVTNFSWVTEANGRKWITQEPAICFFYPNKWFNIISMIRKKGLFFYCNIASPSLYDGEAIKNIDYDLDVKVFPDGSYKILDENEYLEHSKEMNYSEEIKEIIEKQVNNLLAEITKGRNPFNTEFINEYYQQYLKMTKD